MNKFSEELAELLYPYPLFCVTCGEKSAPNDMLCDACRAKLEGEASLCGFANAEFDMSAAAHLYKGTAGIFVRDLKYHTLHFLARDMARDMVRAAEIAGMQKPDVVTYVPMHRSRRRTKYIDQAEVLARTVAAEWGGRCDGLLQRVRRCKQQALIKDADKRRENVKDAFDVRKNADGLHVLLIDDVYTTGATSRECARALRRAGAARVDLLVYSTAGRANVLCEETV